jgi:hypothetical protein
MAALSSWVVLITNLPLDDAALRMRIMRTLEATGCAVLRDGVYLLPDSPPHRKSFGKLGEYINAARGGGAHFFAFQSTDAAQEAAFRALFDRTREYMELVKIVEAMRAGFGISEPASIARVLSKQRRELTSLIALDFFPGPARERAGKVLDELERQVYAMMFPDEPATAALARRDGEFVRRAWATRKPLLVDRLASAWLIRRFIDPEAIMVWLDKGQALPDNAVGFCFEDARFRSRNNRVGFEELLTSFGLEQHHALKNVGALVHYLDAGGTPVAEAPGVDTLLQGAYRRNKDEDELLFEAEKTFDLLYDAYFDTPAKKDAPGAKS